MSNHLPKIAKAAAILVASFGLTTAHASWVQVVDMDTTDGATNPGYPGNQNPATVAAYLQDLLDSDAVLTSQNPQSVYSKGVLSGLGNPASPNTFLLALHFGNSNDAWEHDGPFNVFFSCQSECDSFHSASGFGNYRLYSTGAADLRTPLVGALAVPEPKTLALMGLGLAALGLWRRRY